jgi:four helix bundle protein
MLPLGWIHYDQCTRSLGSVVANIAEGEGRNVRETKYYQMFLLYSRGSACETIAWLDCLFVEQPALTGELSIYQDRLLELSDKLKVAIESRLEEISKPTSGPEYWAELARKRNKEREM